MPYQSAVHSVSPGGGMNLWLPMPFTKHAKFTVTNESGKDAPLFYQISYTLGDKHPGDVDVHVLFRRENPTTEKQDFELLPLRKNKGRFIGTVIRVGNLHSESGGGKVNSKFTWTATRNFPPLRVREPKITWDSPDAWRCQSPSHAT